MFFKAKKGVASSIPDLEETESKAAAAAPVKPAASAASTPHQSARPGDANGRLNGSASHAAPAPADQTAAIDLSKGAAISKRIEAALGEIVAVLMRSEAHQAMTLGELRSHVLPGVLLGQFSLAEAQSKNNGMTTPVAVVLWANVSDEVDRRLSAVDGPVAPLSPAEWNSGSIPWVLLAVGDQNMVTAMLQNLLKQGWSGKKAKIRIKSADGKVSVSTLEIKAPEAAAV